MAIKYTTYKHISKKLIHTNQTVNIKISITLKINTS